MKEEVASGWTKVPIQKNELESLARAIKIVGRSNVYPKKIGYSTLGDAHWACLPSTPIYSNVSVKNTVNDLVLMAKEGDLGKCITLCGGRFVSWAIANELSSYMEQIIISDIDPWVEKVTVDNLSNALNTEVTAAGSDDEAAHGMSDSTIICTTVPKLAKKISGMNTGSIELI